MKTNLILPDEKVISKIYLIRNKKVILDRDLSALYGVETPAGASICLCLKSHIELAARAMIRNERLQSPRLKKSRITLTIPEQDALRTIGTSKCSRQQRK